MAALRIVRGEPQRRTKLQQLAEQVRHELIRQDWEVGAGHSQIIPIRVGDPAETLRLAAQLRSRGLLVPGIRPPTVPVGESLLRISLSSAHSEPQVQQLLQALQESRR